MESHKQQMKYALAHIRIIRNRMGGWENYLIHTNIYHQEPDTYSRIVGSEAWKRKEEEKLPGNSWEEQIAAYNLKHGY